MTELDLRADGEGVYAAEVTPDDGGPPRHLRVVVPRSVLDELDLTPVEEPALVRDALGILVRTGAWRDLPDSFELPDAERVHPGFWAELRAVSGP